MRPGAVRLPLEVGTDREKRNGYRSANVFQQAGTARMSANCGAIIFILPAVIALMDGNGLTWAT